MSSFWSRNISLSIFGESHGPAIGVVIDNLPPGEYIDVEKLRQFMARRAPKKDGTTTPRGEKDLPQIMSGLLNDRTTGVPLCAFIQNTDTRSKDYSNLARLPRPGHADYTGAMRYRGFNDVRGGGHFPADSPLRCALPAQSAVRFWSAGVFIPVRTSPASTASAMTLSAAPR